MNICKKVLTRMSVSSLYQMVHKYFSKKTTKRKAFHQITYITSPKTTPTQE